MHGESWQNPAHRRPVPELAGQLEAHQARRPGPDLSPEASRYFASLPGDRFPNLVAAAGEFAQTDFDERFELLIRIFIDGLAAQARLS